MKLMIASDIHGSYDFCRLMTEAFHRERADKLLLLGDLLYHGPRNDLPPGYAPKQVISILNEMKDHILCIRGNCDTEVDQMVLEFPIMADYALIMTDAHQIYATHGHQYNESNLPPLQSGAILLCGHTHVPKCMVHENYIYLNPGSISIPKEDSCHSYMIYDESGFSWRILESGSEYDHFSC